MDQSNFGILGASQDFSTIVTPQGVYSLVQPAFNNDQVTLLRVALYLDS